MTNTLPLAMTAPVIEMILVIEIILDNRDVLPSYTNWRNKV